MKQKTRFKKFGSIGIGFKKAIPVNLLHKLQNIRSEKLSNI